VKDEPVLLAAWVATVLQLPEGHSEIVFDPQKVSVPGITIQMEMVLLLIF
jgi:hypothetical protein